MDVAGKAKYGSGFDVSGKTDTRLRSYDRGCLNRDDNYVSNGTNNAAFIGLYYSEVYLLLG